MRTTAIRLGAGCVTIAIVLLLVSQCFLLTFDTFNLQVLHAPMWISVALAAVAIAGLLGFALRPGRARALYAAAGLAALLLLGFSLRAVGDYITGEAQEYWAGFRISDADHPGDEDYCYRMNGRTFELRGMRFRSRFAYWRGIWPTAFSEDALRKKFAPNAEIRRDGWICAPPTPSNQLLPGREGVGEPLPRNANGKILKKDLKTMFAEEAA